MKELEILLPKSISFNSAFNDLKEECLNFFQSLQLQGKSPLTITEYARTISHFINFFPIHESQPLTFFVKMRLFKAKC